MFTKIGRIIRKSILLKSSRLNEDFPFPTTLKMSIFCLYTHFIEVSPSWWWLPLFHHVKIINISIYKTGLIFETSILLKFQGLYVGFLFPPCQKYQYLFKIVRISQKLNDGVSFPTTLKISIFSVYTNQQNYSKGYFIEVSPT